jgi:ABC-2 type transport system permease protein
LTTPTHRATVIGGHVLAMFLVVFLQQVLLVAVGQIFFGVDYLQAPLATLAMMVALSLWAASLGLLIGALAKAEEQVITWSLIAMFLFAALGGAWFPLEFAGEAFATIGHVTPTAWAMDGLQNVVVRGQGLASVLLPAGILLAYAAAFFGIAVWQFRFE